MDIQSAQPPPFHYMFEANAHGLGAGAQMEVSKYPGGSIQQEQYRSGAKQFRPVPGRGYVYGPSGNWGNRHYYKYTPIKQNGGASGILSQIAQPNAYKYKVANLGRLGRVDPQLPRGGSIMRIVGNAGDGSEDMRSFDSGYDWRNGGQPGPPDLRPPADVGRPDLPGVPPIVNVPGTKEQEALLREPFEEQAAEFRVMNGIPDTPPPEQIPTQAIFENLAQPPNVNAGLPSPDGSDMSVDTVRTERAVEYFDLVVEMEIDEVEKQLISLRGSGAVIPFTQQANMQVESRVLALLESLRTAMEQNGAELPANVLTATGEIIDSIEDVLEEFRRDQSDADNLMQHILLMMHDYRQAIRQAAGSASSSESGSPITTLMGGSGGPTLAITGGSSSPSTALAVRRRDSDSSGPASADTDTQPPKLRRRNTDNFDDAAARRGGKSDDFKVPTLMSAPATTPAKAKKQADWLTRTIDRVVGDYLTPAQKKMIITGVSAYVIDLARNGATDVLESFIERIVRTLRLQANPREIARKIVAFIERQIG